MDIKFLDSKETFENWYDLDLRTISNIKNRSRYEKYELYNLKDSCKELFQIPRSGEIASVGLDYRNCNNLRTLDMSNVTSTEYMFHYCTEFNEPLDWDLSSVEDTFMMFGRCYILDQEFDFKLNDKCHVDCMFLDCYSLRKEPIKLSDKHIGSKDSIYSRCLFLPCKENKTEKIQTTSVFSTVKNTSTDFRDARTLHLLDVIRDVEKYKDKNVIIQIPDHTDSSGDITRDDLTTKLIAWFKKKSITAVRVNGPIVNLVNSKLDAKETIVTFLSHNIFYDDVKSTHVICDTLDTTETLRDVLKIYSIKCKADEVIYTNGLDGVKNELTKLISVEDPYNDIVIVLREYTPEILDKEFTTIINKLKVLKRKVCFSACNQSLIKL